MELWSCVALALATKAGINTPRHRLTTVLDQQLLLITRFDREGIMRIPFLSAMSMIGADENQPHSYLELADAIRQHGADVRMDLKDLTVEVGDYFGLVEDDMRAVVTDLVNSISTWRDEARRIGVSAEEVNRMATAFEHDEMVRAQRFLRCVS